MASLLDDPSGNWLVHFRFGGKRFKRALQTKKETQAQALCGRNRGQHPAGAARRENHPGRGDVFLFLLSDGNVHKPVELPEQITLADVITQYEQSVADSLEESTRYTIAVHTRHLKRLLGETLDPPLDQSSATG